ncbi:Cobalamin-binding domain-containing protein [Desulfonema limicola]|uniref:Cobalamin-binding domain-containing protein n=1 Tax=Desulfonema limicola TaxID=45656 RepID=A0A975B8N4_9BACT|nr:cobalamin-dependent protein [Desulfonema limicola]QTA80829.1 Cobalamin-binding domain-containing protein [Desulfonema limicola]
MQELKQKPLKIISDGSKLIQKPQEDEIEISVFGPGYGESILLHIGMNKWIIVDSCIFPGETNPAPLNYLKEIDIDYSESVKVIAATHWHDDHIKGLSKIFKECRNSEFICSDALKCDEFIELIQVYSDSVISENSGIEEFKLILNEMQERQKKRKNNNVPKFAISDRLLWQDNFEVKGNSIKSEIFSLSPCDAAILSAKLDITSLLPSEGANKRVIPQIKPNHSSVVLWIAVNNFNIMLGTDLEEEGNPYKGWSVIVNSTTRPDGKASFFKIPHHGSKNGHHQEVWEKMLMQNPVSVLTPFARGYKLPTLDDIERICSNTSYAFATGSPAEQKKLKRSNVVEKMIKEFSGQIHLINPSYGHVRYRKKLNSEESSIELFGNSVYLCSVSKEEPIDNLKDIESDEIPYIRKVEELVFWQNIHRQQRRAMQMQEIIAQYNEAIFDTDRDLALQVVNDALEKGISPEDMVFKVIIPAIEQMVKSISENFDANLAQHFIASQIAAEVTENMIARFEKKPASMGNVVIGTAEGDLHSLGKRIVIGCLKTLMIDVFDIGVNVAPEKFVDEAVARNAQVIGISAMMVHTARGENGCLKVREILKERGLEGRIKIIVGGAPFQFDPELYKAVKADAWAKDGITGGKIITELIKEVKS